MTRDGFAAWLRSLDGEALQDLLASRADVVARAPASVAELAQRLQRPDSIAAAVHDLPVPLRQALEALQALGEHRTASRLAALLDGSTGPAHRETVDGVLDALTGLGLVWPGTGAKLHVPTGLGEAYPEPLGLGPPARALWSDQYSEDIARAGRALGTPPATRKADRLELLLARLADSEFVRAVVARAPDHIAEELHRIAEGGDDDAPYYDQGAYQLRRATETWGIEHGLLTGRAWGYGGIRMPAEVALALRGPDYRAPFTPAPPPITPRVVTAETVASAAAAALTSLASKAPALLDRLARSPVPQLAAGGIGVRELARLTKELAAEEDEVRLILELAGHGRLLERVPGGLGVGDRFRAWRATEPAAQVTDLLHAWWTFPSAPTQSRDENGKALPALSRRGGCAGCRLAREAVLATMTRLPDGLAADQPELAATALWNRPAAHVLPQDEAAPLATVWREAELLGVIAAGALSPVGTALLAGDLPGVHDHLRELLPAATEQARFGSDLTALVPGTPSARVSALLDSCADRESSGGAVTWRFSPASVRRALDAGASAEHLIEQLAPLADRELPQPLTYLIADVGRRHGRLRLTTAASLIRSDDEALLAEAAADRRLAALGLRRLAPTVLACDLPLEAALARLRDAGYFPVAEEEPRPAPGATTAGTKPVTKPVTKRQTKPRVVRTAPSVTARSLVAALRDLGSVLSGGELLLLAQSIEDGDPVQIEYQAASGAVTDRVIRDAGLDGHLLYAWCELRDDERVFSVPGIRSVVPAY